MIEAIEARADGGTPTVDLTDPVQGRARILIGCCIGGFFNLSSVMIYAFGVFAVGIARELGISTLEATRLIGPALLATIVAQPIVGWIVDRWSRRGVALTGLGLLAGSTTCMTIAPASQPAISIFIVVAVILSCLSSPTVYNAYISQIFDKRRGLAMGLATGCTGLGIAIIPPIAARLTNAYGWREAYAALTGAIIVALLANMLLFPKATDKPPPRQPGRTKDVLRIAMRNPVFWVLAALYFLIPITANALPIYLPLLLGQRGASGEIAAASLTALGLTMIVSRPILGFLIDRWPNWIVLSLLIMGPLFGSAALLWTTGVPAAFAAGIGYGIGIGGEFVSLAYIVSRTFGVRDFGIVYGWLSIFIACGVASGPIAVGILSSDHDFGTALEAIMLVSVLALALTLVLRHYQRRAVADTAGR